MSDRSRPAEPSTDGTVEVFADVICPFTHVGLRRLTARRGELRLEAPVLVVRAWPLEIVNGAPISPDFVLEEVEALRATVAPDLFAHFDRDKFPRSSLPSLALAARAEAQGVGERCSLALRDALFEHGRDLNDPRELDRIASEAGVRGKVGPEDDASVLADLEDGRARGVIGSPHFFVGGVSFFCPSLKIERVDGHLHLDVDLEGFEALAGECFGPAEPSRIPG